MKKQFTEKDLVDFGNYLLSFKRKGTIKKEVNKRKVHDCDIANFKDNNMKKSTKEECKHTSIEEIQGGQIERCRQCGKTWGGN